MPTLSVLASDAKCENVISIISQNLREAGFDLNEDDVQEWLAIVNTCHVK